MEPEYIIDTFEGELGVWNLIKWRGLPEEEASWEIAEDPKELGLPESTDENHNGVYTTTAMKKLRQLSRLNSYRDVPVCQYIGQPLQEPEVGLLAWRDHLHVVARYKGQIWLGDGENRSARDTDLRKRIRLAASVGRIRTLKYEYQEQFDHCASSAILMAAEVMRNIRQGQQLAVKLDPPTKMRQRIVRQLHPHRGERRARLDLRKIGKKCRYCGKGIVKRSNLKRHEAICRKRNITA